MRHREIFDAIVEAFSTGEIEATRTLFGADYIDHQQPEDSNLVGPDEFAVVVTGARHKLIGLTVSVTGSTTWSDDLCSAILTWHGHDPTGALIVRETVETLRLNSDSEIIEHWGVEVHSRRG